MKLIQKSLSEICTVKTGKRDANHGDHGGDYVFFTCADKSILSPTFSFDGEAIILPGNGANVGLVFFYDGKFEAYQRTYILQDFKCDSRFLFYHLKGYWKIFNANKQFGSATNYIKMQNFDDYKIPLPPLEEQKRIAVILDKADRVRRKRQEAIRLTEELGRSIFLDMFGDPVTNPKGWEKKVLCDVSEILTGYAFKSNQYTQNNKDIRLCRGINILPECMNWNDTAYWNKNNIRDYEKFILRNEDIVIAMDRPWISSGFKIAMIQPSDLPSLLVQRVARIRGKSSEWQKYLYSVIQHPAFELHSNPTETTVPHISPKDLQSFPIPVPDEVTLRSFNEKIRAVDIIKKKSLGFYQESENLFNSLLQRAFRGEL